MELRTKVVKRPAYGTAPEVAAPPKEKQLSASDLTTIRNKLMKTLIAMTWIDPALKELLKGVTLDLKVLQVPSSSGTVSADEFMKEPEAQVRLDIKKLPLGYGKHTHYILATFPDGQLREVSQHKSQAAAQAAKRKLEKHGVALNLLLNPFGGSVDAEEEAQESSGPEPDANRARSRSVHEGTE